MPFAGGARATALIAWNPATSEVRSNQLDLLDGFEPWLLKFDGVAMTKGRENSSLQSIL
jgi:serine/threonine-protein kinase HipA